MKKSIILSTAFLLAVFAGVSLAGTVIWGFNNPSTAQWLESAGMQNLSTTELYVVVLVEFSGSQGVAANQVVASVKDGTFRDKAKNDGLSEPVAIIPINLAELTYLPGEVYYGASSPSLSDSLDYRGLLVAIDTSPGSGGYIWYVSGAIPLYNFNSGFNTSAFTTGSPNKGTFIPVPEPATGALALAGLALLFRRKRVR